MSGIAGLMLLLAVACTESDPRPPDNRQVAATTFEGTIVAMGNSLTEGYGLDPESAYPGLLEQMLAAKGYPFRVVNAGISGETSSGAASRLDWVLKLDPDIVIVETGANDAFRGIDPQLVRDNIAAIIQRFQSQGIVVVLTGMKMVTNLGPEYTSAFENLYHDLARKFDVVFMPFFLKEVAAVPELNLSDGIHPNARGHAVIAENLLPYVIEAIERWRQIKAAPAAD
jgi:acyl-CoA thioesterase-1